MNKYESIIIIKSTLTEDEVKEMIDKYKEKIEKFSEKLVETENLGKKKLAYEIQGNKEGYYVIFNFYGKPEDVANIERSYRIDDNVMKFITVRQEMEEKIDSDTMEDEDDMQV